MKTYLPKAPKSLAHAFFPSLLGILCFLVPWSYQGQRAICIAHLSQAIHHHLAPYLSPLLLLMMSAATLVSCVVTLSPSQYFHAKKWHPFNTSLPWLSMRIIGACWSCITFYGIGPQWLWHSSTGGLMLFELLPKLLINLVVAALLSPLLLEFGLLEFIGTFTTALMRPLFKLPGRAAVNCIASWFGDGTMGTLIALQAYEKKNYTRRETLTIISCFSAVSLTFYVMILTNLRLESHFTTFCLTTFSSSLIAAFILVRIPPLSSMEEDQLTRAKALQPNRGRMGMWQQALMVTQEKINDMPPLADIVKKSLKNILAMITGLLPTVMCIGSASLVVGTYTPIFQVLGKPFIPLFELLGVPEAEKASEAVLIGFTDMFIPTVLAQKISSPITRFIVGVLSVTQIISLSELGPLLLSHKKLRIKAFHLFWLFLLRTFITLPIIVGMARVVFV